MTVILLILLSCTESPATGETISERGRWRLALEDTQYDQGVTDIHLWIEDAQSGEPGLQLDVLARATMEGMDHGSDTVTLEEEGEGLYTGELSFSMAGIWSITGYVTEEEDTEAYTLSVEVLP